MIADHKVARWLCIGVSLSAIVLSSAPLVAQESRVNAYLREGDLSAGEDDLANHLAEQPNDDQARFGLGVLQILQSVENLGQALYQHGLRNSSPDLPFVRLPVPDNPSPEPITYEKFHEIMQAFVDDLATAQQTLAQVQDNDVKLRVPFGMIRLDLNGDGVGSEQETFWQIFTALARRAGKLDESQQEFVIAFDFADVHWMMGYTHLLRAMAEAYLAHDSREFFDGTAHIFFKGAQSPYAGLDSGQQQQSFDLDTIADLIAAIHLFRWEPQEPERMARALEHLQQMIGHSRECWKAIQKETDDDREWIPSANQTSLVPLVVNEERIQGWHRFLDESESILAGETLVPHWRIKDGRGINVRRVFTEPRTFDLIMWAHGAAALPYLEEGSLTDQQTWTTLRRTFGGNFLVFAVWFQ